MRVTYNEWSELRQMLKFRIVVAISDLPANQQSQSGLAQLEWI